MGCGGSSHSYKEPRKIETKFYNEFEKNQVPSLSGKVVLITGCTTGTGFITACCAARKGATVVMLNRKSSRAEAAEEQVKKEVSNDGKVMTVECDLQDMDNVKAAAEKIKELFSESGVDVLCNNAGVMALADEATKDGYDVQMQTNHLSHFLLTKEIFPLLEKGAALRGEARIVNHSSGARAMPSTPVKAKYYGKNGGALGGNGNSMFCGGARWERYHQTKLANAVFTVELAERLKGANSKVKCLVAAPGLAATNLQVTTNQNDGMNSTWIMKYGQSAEDGTMPLVQCCFGAGSENGDFFEPETKSMGMRVKGMPKKFPLEPICTKAESRKILWEESEKACGAFLIGA